jgi:uncharacterized damage-inducible protein DinB
MNLSPIAEIRQKLRQSRQETLQLARQIDEETACYRLQPGAWSIKEHLVHLAAVEESIIDFARRILAEDGPISPLCYEAAFNQENWNDRQVAERAAYTWPEVIIVLERTHRQLLELLADIPVEALKRIGSHPIWGEPVTLASILRIPYRHERGHRDEIAALRQNIQHSKTVCCQTAP